MIARPTRRYAFTLLEVVVGMVLMAGLVSGTVLALTDQQSALRTAANRRDACVVAEQMLDVWMESVQGIPPRERGIVSAGEPRRQNWTWRTEPIGSRLVMGVPAQIIRFQIVDPSASKRTGRPTLLVQLDLVRRTRSGVR